MTAAEETPQTPPPATPAPTPKKGLSTGAKVAIGCGALVVLALIVIVVVTVAGGLFLKDKAEEFTGGLEAQQEAMETVQRLEREHPFTPPADGVVGEERAERFLDVTDDAWESMRDLVEEIVERGEEIEAGDRGRFGDLSLGLRGLGGARIALVEALDEHEMSISEYLWTGITLQRAYQFLEAPAQEGVPAENLAVADANRDALAEILEGDGEAGRPDKSFVLGIAWTLGATEGTVRNALGLDTLSFPRR